MFCTCRILQKTQTRNFRTEGMEAEQNLVLVLFPQVPPKTDEFPRDGGGRFVRFQWFCASFFLTHRDGTDLRALLFVCLFSVVKDTKK